MLRWPPILVLFGGALCAALAGCGAHDAPAVDLTLRFDGSVSDEALARIVRLSVSATGDEQGTYDLLLSRPAARAERTVYRPLPSSRSLSLAVVAFAADDAVVATGTTGVLGPAAGQVLEVDVTMGVGSLDGGVQDGALHDAAVLPPGPLVGLSLVNAASLMAITGFDPIADGATITLGNLPTKSLSIVANVAASVGSIAFDLDDGAFTHGESSTPYTLCGDAGASATACPQLDAIGPHTLKATAFGANVDAGVVAGTLVITFTID